MINVMLTCMQLDRLGVLCPHKTPVVTERERVCVRSGHSWLSPFLLTSVYTAGGYWRRSAVQAARSQSGESDLRPDCVVLVPGGSDQPCSGPAPGRQEAALLFPDSQGPCCTSHALKNRPLSAPPRLGCIALKVTVTLPPPAQKVTTLHSITHLSSKG